MSHVRIITLLSDFGATSPYPGEMRLALAARTNAVLVDITHDVPPHDIRVGAYLLRAAAPHAPAGTVHLAVVDPGVGTARRALIIRSGGQDFVGPDNGLLLPAARRIGRPRAFAITDLTLARAVRSSTFHGRDLFAPAAALLSRGTPPEALGAAVPEVVDLDLGMGHGADRPLVGTVVYIDPFGNLVTTIPSDLLPAPGQRVEVQVGTRRLRGTVRSTYGHAARSAVLVIPGSDGAVEIAVREGHAARRLGARTGMMVRITEPSSPSGGGDRRPRLTSRRRG